MLLKKESLVVPTAQEYRTKAAECGALLESEGPFGTGRQVRQRQDSYLALAANEDWLAEHTGAYYSNRQKGKDCGYDLVDCPDQSAVTVVLSGSDHGELTGPTRLVFGQPMVLHSPKPGNLSSNEALAMGATLARDLGVRLVVVDRTNAGIQLSGAPASRAI